MKVNTGSLPYAINGSWHRAEKDSKTEGLRRGKASERIYTTTMPTLTFAKHCKGYYIEDQH